MSFKDECLIYYLLEDTYEPPILVRVTIFTYHCGTRARKILQSRSNHNWNISQVDRMVPLLNCLQKNTHKSWRVRYTYATTRTRHPPVDMVTRLTSSAGSSMISNLLLQATNGRSSPHNRLMRYTWPWPGTMSPHTQLETRQAMQEPAAATHCVHFSSAHRFIVILGSVIVSQDRYCSFEADNRTELTKNVANVCGDVNQASLGRRGVLWY